MRTLVLSLYIYILEEAPPWSLTVEGFSWRERPASPWVFIRCKVQRLYAMLETNGAAEGLSWALSAPLASPGAPRGTPGHKKLIKSYKKLS